MAAKKKAPRLGKSVSGKAKRCVAGGAGAACTEGTNSGPSRAVAGGARTSVAHRLRPLSTARSTVSGPSATRAARRPGRRAGAKITGHGSACESDAVQREQGRRARTGRCEPPAGVAVPPPDPEVTGSTLTEINASPESRQRQSAAQLQSDGWPARLACAWIRRARR